MTILIHKGIERSAHKGIFLQVNAAPCTERENGRGCDGHEVFFDVYELTTDWHSWFSFSQSIFKGPVRISKQLYILVCNQTKNSLSNYTKLLRNRRKSLRKNGGNSAPIIQNHFEFIYNRLQTFKKTHQTIGNFTIWSILVYHRTNDTNFCYDCLLFGRS